jgi:TonB-dependent receptor
VGGPTINDPTVFTEFNQLRSQPSTAKEKETNLGGNARLNFRAADEFPAYVKFGAQARLKEKSQDRERINWTAPASFTFASLAQGQSGDDYAFLTGPRINAQLFTTTFTDNKAAYTATRDLTNSLSDDWTTKEDVYAGYLMGGVTLGTLNLTGGARYERTEFDASGNTLRTTAGVITASPGKATRSYGNFLPSLALRSTLDKKTVLRASYSSSLARPAFGDSKFGRSVNDDTKLVAQSNPGLKALTSTNYDVSVEHYFASLGTVSLAAFYKDIKDFTYQVTLPGVDAETGYPLTTFVNGPKGHISGLEFAWQQQFRFLPSPFDGLGFLVNCTLSDSAALYYRSSTGTLENAPFIGQSQTIGNVALSYEKYGLFVRVALNYRSPRLREDELIGASVNEDRYVDEFKQLDLTASYKLNRQLELFGEVLNLTNEPFRVAFGEKRTRFIQFEEYGWSANFGVRWKL